MDAIKVKLCEFPTIRVSLENISVNNSGIGTSHTSLRDCDLADQHPISAITGLEDALKATGEEKITEAVESALASAKESGDFDGESVTVSDVTESSESGGVSVVTFSDGKKVNIKNGLDGKKGDKGDPYTLTEADKAEIVAMVIESLGGNPIFGYVDENNIIVLNGDLADGSYSVKYEMEDGSTVDIGNMELDSNVYYSITKNLTNCTTNNSALSIVEGGSYSATITADEGYELSSVVVTMGGSAVAVTDGVINIASVTGDIVITAVAEEVAAEPTNFIEYNATNTTDWSIWCNDARIGSDGNYRSSTTQNVTNYIAVQNGDTVYWHNMKINLQVIGMYNSGKTMVAAQNTVNHTANGYITDVTTLDESTNEGHFTITNASVAYIRFTLNTASAEGAFSEDSAIVNIQRNGEWL